MSAAATANTVRSSFSTVAFAQLVKRLRLTNARYNEIARQFRHRIRRTYHAQRRAHRSGLCIDTSKARACPSKYVSAHPPPVLDMSSSHDPARVDAPTRAHDTADTTIGGDAYMRGMAHDVVPEHVVRQHRGQDGRPRITLRLPPLRLLLDVDCSADVAVLEGPAPGAPRMLPRQLPEDECDTGERTFGSSVDASESSLLAPVDVQAYSGFRITIPPRGLKRKLQDVETDDNPDSLRQPKRVTPMGSDDPLRR